MKKLEYKIHIHAPKQKVWAVMLQPDSYKEWAGASWPGSFYEGNWMKNEKIKFISKDGSGTIACIKEIKPYDYILTEHIAILLEGGKENTDSGEAKGWIGTKENFRFNGKDNETDLTIEITTSENWQKMFDDGYPNALKKLKEICER